VPARDVQFESVIITSQIKCAGHPANKSAALQQQEHVVETLDDCGVRLDDMPLLLRDFNFSV
jgi:hypothetical protein